MILVTVTEWKIILRAMKFTVDIAEEDHSDVSFTDEEFKTMAELQLRRLDSGYNSYNRGILSKGILSTEAIKRSSPPAKEEEKEEELE